MINPKSPLAETAGETPAQRGGVFAGGGDAPEKREVKVGFIALTDCASIVMASVLGFDQKYGIQIVPRRETSWAGVRDKLLAGELDLAHMLYGLVYGVHMGIGCKPKAMAVLMALNHNGQGITLSNKLANQGATDLAGLVSLMRSEPRPYTFAHTFPTGTHAMWLYYWLASAGVNPLTDVNCTVVSPTQMVANMRMGNVDGFSAGEPWNHMAVADGVGVTADASQGIWKDHPEKVLGGTAEFAKNNPHTARAAVMAVLEASRWIDASDENRLKTAQTLAQKAFVNTRADVISQRLLGHYENGMGQIWQDSHPMAFFNDGAVNFPYLSDGMWFMTQHKRWGLLNEHPDYLGVAQQINQIELYRDAASALHIAVPTDNLRSSTLMDGKVWNGQAPTDYADSFAVQAPARAPALAG
jgi:nitrate/nitrite transport system substrate-binding protein